MAKDNSEFTRREFFAKSSTGRASIGAIGVLGNGIHGNLSKIQNQNKEVIYRTLGKTGLRTPVIGMGVMIIKRGRKISLQLRTTQTPNRSRMLILTGALATISNPYWFIWWATIGTTYTVWSLKMGISGVASFFSGHILGDLVWYALVSLIIASGRRILSNTIYRGLLIACGIGLLALGGYFTISGFRFLTG